MTILLLQRKTDGFVIVFFKSTTKLADVLRLPDPPHPHMHSKGLFRRLNHPENNGKKYICIMNQSFYSGYVSTHYLYHYAYKDMLNK